MQSQINRFLTSGAIGVTAGYIVLYVLTEYLDLWYLSSSIVGFIVNMVVNFFLQRTWTFRSTSPESHRQFMRYALLYGLLFLTNTAILYSGTEYLRLWYMVSQIIASIICTIISYHVSVKIFA